MMQNIKKGCVDYEVLEVIKRIAQEHPVDQDPTFWEKFQDQQRNAALNAALDMIEVLMEENKRLHDTIEKISESLGAYSGVTKECDISI